MFRTIKPNKEYWGKKIPILKYGVPNPLNVFSTDTKKFSDALGAFKFSGVFKTTRSGRHKQTQLFLKNQLDNISETVSILDIGASDGSTSLDFMILIDDHFKKYYVTDYKIECTYFAHKGFTYFLDNDQDCILVASEKFVFYPKRKWLFNLLFKRTLSFKIKYPKNELFLINRDLQERKKSNDGIEIIEYNIFESWSKEKLDIVIVANLLNRAYFSDDQIETALKNCYETLAENGLLVVIRNSIKDNNEEIEKSAIYKKNGMEKNLEKIHEVNGGIEINNLILALQF